MELRKRLKVREIDSNLSNSQSGTSDEEQFQVSGSPFENLTFKNETDNEYKTCMESDPDIKEESTMDIGMVSQIKTEGIQNQFKISRKKRGVVGTSLQRTRYDMYSKTVQSFQDVLKGLNDLVQKF